MDNKLPICPVCGSNTQVSVNQIMCECESTPHATLDDINEWIERVGAERGKLEDIL